MSKKIRDDNFNERIKSKIYITDSIDDDKENKNNYNDDKYDKDDNENSENLNDQIINQIKSIFINHFNLTNKTIGELLDEAVISRLIDLFLKK
jgi:hypothetical protein